MTPENPYTMTLRVKPASRRAQVTLTAPDSPGICVVRPGVDEAHAIANALRGLATMVDARRREALRQAGGTTWVRLSIDVDVEVEASQVEAARRAETGAQAGDMNAAQDVMNLALEWLATAMYDKDSRDWQSFDWALVEDCDPDDFPEA
jgi:hypothetical protein